MQTFFKVGHEGDIAPNICELAGSAFGLSYVGSQLEERDLRHGELDNNSGVWKRQLENRLKMAEIHILAASQLS